jgi:hypothetical protein
MIHERVPIIMTDMVFNAMQETNGTAWFGKYLDDMSMFAETTFENQNTIPFAALLEKYNAVCWEPCADFTPKQMQDNHPGSQVSWHPGFCHHQWQGRKLALLLLKGLREAFQVWEQGTQQDGFPLADSYWHVGDMYKLIRNNLRTHITTPKEGGDDVRLACEQMIPWLPRICRVQMHGYGMWTPRYTWITTS